VDVTGRDDDAGVADELAHVRDVGGEDWHAVGEVVGDGAAALECGLRPVREDTDVAGRDEREPLGGVEVVADDDEFTRTVLDRSIQRRNEVGASEFGVVPERAGEHDPARMDCLG
jgi:hypothetical protein